MPYNLQIIRTSDFLRLNSKGGFDLEGTRKVLVSLAKTCIDRGIDSALLDVREAKSDLQLNDLYQLALAFKEMGFRKSHRLAILHRSRVGERLEFFAMEPGERAEFFATCAADEGWNVRAFDDYEAAMEWFGVGLPLE